MHSLVYLYEEDLFFLRKESVIDCNEIRHIRKSDLVQYIDPKKERYVRAEQEKISKKLRMKLCEAVMNSPVVKPYIKELVKKNIK